MNWPQKRIGDYLSESSIETSAPSAERRIRVRLNAEGIEKRPLIAETEGATRYFQRRAGQFIYGKQNLHKGAFGVVPPELDGFESSSDLPAFDVTDGLRPEWLEYFLKQGNYYKSLVAIAKGAATKRIQPEALFAVELPVPPTKVQDEIIKRMDRCALEHTRLEHEITHQQSLLAKLKQAILQEAIQGKLTADWRGAHPDVEPASQLLHRIQAEKAHLIAAKKLRPEKPLPKITRAEIPFEIPKGWEWCRFGSYARFERGRFSARPRNDKRFFGGPYPFIQIGSLDSHGSVVTEATQTLNDAGLAVSKMFEAGTIAVAIVGGTIGNLGVLGRDMCFTDSVVGVRPSKLTCQDFILLLMRRKQPEIQSVAYQRAGQPNISLPNLTDILIPLPPLAEQAAIVERVEALMTTCRSLESEIAAARTHAAHLLQAVLKEAFAPAAGVAA
jgi:type I restriction enzyme S subunit